MLVQICSFKRELRHVMGTPPLTLYPCSYSNNDAYNVWRALSHVSNSEGEVGLVKEGSQTSYNLNYFRRHDPLKPCQPIGIIRSVFSMLSYLNPNMASEYASS